MGNYVAVVCPSFFTPSANQEKVQAQCLARVKDLQQVRQLRQISRKKTSELIARNNVDIVAFAKKVKRSGKRPTAEQRLQMQHLRQQEAALLRQLAEDNRKDLGLQEKDAALSRIVSTISEITLDKQIANLYRMANLNQHTAVALRGVFKVLQQGDEAQRAVSAANAERMRVAFEHQEDQRDDEKEVADMALNSGVDLASDDDALFDIEGLDDSESDLELADEVGLMARQRLSASAALSRIAPSPPQTDPGSNGRRGGGDNNNRGPGANDSQLVLANTASEAAATTTPLEDMLLS